MSLWVNYFRKRKETGTLLLEERDIIGLVTAIGLTNFLDELILRMESGFRDFSEGKIKVPARHEFFFEKGTVESMPCADSEFFAVKLVNTHPKNPSAFGLPTIIACGALIDGETGYPVLLTESTVLTALRTASASAVATKHLANKTSNFGSFGIIGAGAQAIPQMHAISRVADFSKTYVSDLSRQSARQFRKSASRLGFGCEIADAKTVCERAELITTATCKKRDGKPVVLDSWVGEGRHINAVGGDSPGKFELEKALLLRSKVVVDFYDQAMVEGEAQQLDRKHVHCDLGAIISGKKKSRESKDEITIFDSTGFAMEDLVTYRYLLELAEKFGLGKMINIIANPKNAKDLYESFFF